MQLDVHCRDGAIEWLQTSSTESFVALIPSMLMLAWLVWRMPSEEHLLAGLICRLDHEVDKFKEPISQDTHPNYSEAESKPITAAGQTRRMFIVVTPLLCTQPHQEISEVSLSPP